MDWISPFWGKRVGICQWGQPGVSVALAGTDPVATCNVSLRHFVYFLFLFQRLCVVVGLLMLVACGVHTKLIAFLFENRPMLVYLLKFFISQISLSFFLFFFFTKVNTHIYSQRKYIP